MRTTLPKQIATKEQAEAFLAALIANDEVYHPEDDARDILWSCAEPPTHEECDTLNALMGQIYDIPDFDPCEFILRTDPNLQQF